MSVLDPQPTRTRAPAWAGVGLRLELSRPRFPPPSWPEDWWQRNCDDCILDPDTPDPVRFCGRQLEIPGFPYPPPQLWPWVVPQ